MDDLISRQAAINVVKEAYENDEMFDGYEYRLQELPSEQSEPKRGHWIKADVCGDTTSWECSCCHNWTGLPTEWNVNAKLWFCPKCGADMRGREDE